MANLDVLIVYAHRFMSQKFILIYILKNSEHFFVLTFYNKSIKFHGATCILISNMGLNCGI